ncbi:MAG: hypothetical protein L6R38_005755 [Xanthoria sp. 2 TBL-2021]|nr:MAG: hypothetical protein L6R38_005755 [Xanthoria sp. 2 TBL-2021]
MKCLMLFLGLLGMAVAAPIPDVAAHGGTTSVDAGPSTATATAFSTLTTGSTSSTPLAAATGVFTYTGTAITVSGTSIVVPSAATSPVFPPPVVVVEAARSLPSASGLSAELVHVGLPQVNAVHFDADGHISGSADSVHVGAPEHSSAAGICAECAHVGTPPIHVDADGHIPHSAENHHVGAPAHVSVTPGQHVDAAAGDHAHMVADDGSSADGNWCVGAPHCTEDHHHSARDRVKHAYSFAAHGGHSSSSSSSSSPAGVAAASAHAGTNVTAVSADGNYGIGVHLPPQSATPAERPYRFAAHGGHSSSPSAVNVSAESVAILPRATASSVDGNHGIGVPHGVSAKDSCVGAPHCQHPASPSPSPSPSPSAESTHVGFNATAVSADGNYGIGVPSAAPSPSGTSAEHGHVGAPNHHPLVPRDSDIDVAAEDSCVGSPLCIHGHFPSPSPSSSTTSAEGGCVGCPVGVHAGVDGGS